MKVSREILRQKVIEKAGITPDMTEWEVLQAVDALVMKRFKYTFDEDLRADPSLGIVAGKKEQWFSRHVELLMTDHKVKDDCDGYMIAGIEMMSLLGFDQRRIAYGLVVDDIKIKEGWAPIYQNITHAVGLCYLRAPGAQYREWHICFDTWGQSVSPSIVPATQRHGPTVLAPVSQGITFEEFPNSIPFSQSHWRGMKRWEV